ncbi:MAG TPA: hypothetical protein DD716_01165 [Thiomicrospira sp.]|jgi:uncharacterized protein|nr:hypothetical protein [Thiomicrospira sp.]
MFSLTLMYENSIIRTMFNKLPDLIDPIYFAQHQKSYEVEVPIAIFSRLIEQVLSEDGLVKVSINFFRHTKLRVPAFNLVLETKLALKCQRSLGSFEYLVQSEIVGVFVESMAMAKDIPAEFEVYELIDDKISLYEIIEEELLLNIPLAPIDVKSEMAYQNTQLVEDESDEAPKKQNQQNPFAALKALQKNK